MADDCDKCGGGGWVWVQPGYAKRLFRDLTLEQATGMGPEMAAEHKASIELNRAAAQDSVYPCDVCNHALFLRWAGGHLASKHDAHQCDECREVLGLKGHRRSQRAEQQLPRLAEPEVIDHGGDWGTERRDLA